MLELYQDTLMDLLLPPQPKGRSVQPPDPPKLEIKKDPKGMVTVTGATVVEVTSAKWVRGSCSGTARERTDMARAGPGCTRVCVPGVWGGGRCCNGRRDAVSGLRQGWQLSSTLSHA